MCRRIDSINAVTAAAEQLTEVCEAQLHGPPHLERIDPAHADTARAVRYAFQNLTTTPADMAVQLGKMK